MGNCSSKDGVRDDETAPLPQPKEPATVVSPKAAQTVTSPSKPPPLLNTASALKDWSTHDIQVWLRTLPPHLVGYSPILMGPGIKVVEWTEQTLTDLGVRTAEHRQDLIKCRQQLQVEISSAQTADQKPWAGAEAVPSMPKEPVVLATPQINLTSSMEDAALVSKRSLPSPAPLSPSIPSPAMPGVNLVVPPPPLPSARSLSPQPTARSASADLSISEISASLSNHRILSPDRERTPEVQPSGYDSMASSGVSFPVAVSGPRDMRTSAEERPDRDSLRNFIMKNDPGLLGDGLRDQDREARRSPSQEPRDGSYVKLNGQRSGGLESSQDFERPGRRERGPAGRGRDELDSDVPARWDGAGYDPRDGPERRGDRRGERRGNGYAGEGMSPRYSARRDRLSPEPRDRMDRVSPRRERSDRMSPEMERLDRRDRPSPERPDRRDRRSPLPGDRDRDMYDRPDRRSPLPRERSDRSERERMDPRRERLSPAPGPRGDRLSPAPRDRVSPRRMDRMPSDPLDGPPRRSSGPRERRDRLSPEPRSLDLDRPVPVADVDRLERSGSYPIDRRPSPLRDSRPSHTPSPSLDRITEPEPLVPNPAPEPFRNPLSGWPHDDAVRGSNAGVTAANGAMRASARSAGGISFDANGLDLGLNGPTPSSDYDKGLSGSRSYGEAVPNAREMDLAALRRGAAGSLRNPQGSGDWRDEGLTSSLDRSLYAGNGDLVVASSTERPIPATTSSLNGLGFMRADPPSIPANLPDLGPGAANVPQILSNSSARGQAVRLLSLVENSRQRWDEEGRHVEALLRHAADALPAPGAQLSNRLRAMYTQLDNLMLNQIHYRKMYERALAVLALMCEVLAAAPMTRSKWRSYAARLSDILLAVEEYMTPVSGKSWLGVLVTGGWSSDLMLSWWRQLADLGGEMSADAAGTSSAVDECVARFSMSCKFDDESSKMKNLISALGGIAVVMGEPKKTLELCAMLNTRKRHQKLTVNQVLQAALLMECTVESGPHSIIPNDAMRMLWYRCFPARHSVSWSEFWKVFPGVLPDLGVDVVEVEALNSLFKDVQRRQNMQQRISSGSVSGVSAFNIREAFPRNVSLQEACVVASDENRSSPGALLDHSPPAGLFGRDEDLPVLMTSLVEVWRPSLVVLQGDTGRGKSSLVNEVASRLRKLNYPPGGVYMVDMIKATTANELSARLCAALGAVLDGDDKTAMWVALQRLSAVGPVLLILEDISAAASSQDGKMALTNLVQQVLAKAPNTRILMTSSAAVDLPGLQLERHILGQLSQEGAMALLQATLPELDMSFGLRLASICQYQPLSLNLAAACLAHGHCSTEDIANLYSEHSSPAAAQHPEVGVLPAVLSVLPQPLVEALTHLVIFPQAFDDRAAALVLRRDVPDTRGLLAALCDRQLIKCHKPTGTYRMHPAIREVATKQLCPSGYPHPAISGFLVSCLEMLRSAGNQYQQCHCTVALQWLNQQRQNLLGLLNLLNSGVLSETLVNQVDDLSQGMEVMTALDIGNPRTFAKMWYILSIGVERVLTPTHPNLATVLSCRADVLARMQHHVEAEKLYKQAMHIISKVPGGAEPQFATVLEKLGMLLSKQGSYEAAAHNLRRALNIKQRILGDDSMEVAEARIKLASVLSQKDADSEEAEQLLTDGYATMVADVAQGNHHPRVIEPFTNLAASYMAQDLHSEAERMYRCVLEVQEDLLEARDPRLVGSLRKLAAACASQNKLDEAESLYKRALQIQQQYYGQGQLESVPVMNKLAAIYSQQGQYDEAEAIFNNALSIQRQHQGENHADLAPTLCELGDLLCKQSKWAKAELAYKEALQVLKAVSAEEKIFARVLVRLATAVEAQDRPQEALALYEQLVTLQRKVVGENSHQVADAYQKMGGVLQQQGDSVKAQAMTEKAVAILQQLVGDAPRLAEALKVLGMQMSANGQHKEAEQKLRHAITIETKAYGPNNLRLTDGLLRLAEVMQRLGELNDAEEATSWVIDINLQGATPSECNNPGIAKLYINLAGIQQQQGKLADAVLSLQRALAIYDRLVARLVAQPAAWRTDELVIKIADLLSENGQYGQAEGYYARAVSEQEATQGAGSLDLATSIFKLALAQSAQSKHSEAEQLYQRALNIRQNALGSGHPDLLPVLSGLAMARGAQGDLPNAERLYFQALEILESHDGMNHPDAANIIDHLHETLESQGKITELGRLYARVRNLKPTTGPSQQVVTKLLQNSQKYNLDVEP